MEKIYSEKISLIKLVVVAAILSLPLQIIYEAFNVEDAFEELGSNKSISIYF